VSLVLSVVIVIDYVPSEMASSHVGNHLQVHAHHELKSGSMFVWHGPHSCRDPYVGKAKVSGQTQDLCGHVRSHHELHRDDGKPEYARLYARDFERVYGSGERCHSDFRHTEEQVW